jgi:hypothetical protein
MGGHFDFIDFAGVADPDCRTALIEWLVDPVAT